MNNYYFTSESVTEGHPDKICDKIADSILDKALEGDSNSKMAVEATIKDDLILIYGEANTKSKIDYEQIAKNVLKEIGYFEEYNVLIKVTDQSLEITNAVVENGNDEVAAGDQGIMFGYACDETDEYMPAPIYYAHKLAMELNKVHRYSEYLGPDGKTQVTIKYEDGKVKFIDTIVISTQHTKELELNDIRKLVIDRVILPTIPKELINENTKFLINPSGSFVMGGSFSDSGTTGRKIVCDSYGGYSRVGGGCFSSKDPTKVDRSAAYYCRYVAKSIIAHGLAKKCEIGVSYAIGKKEPISIFVDSFGTGIMSDDKLEEIIYNNFNFNVSNIIKELDLKNPIYSKTSCYGHFGRNEFSWEKIKEIRL